LEGARSELLSDFVADHFLNSGTFVLAGHRHLPRDKLAQREEEKIVPTNGSEP
jgi:hypothetical protein